MKNILYIIIISIILSILFNLIYIKYNNNIYNKNNIDSIVRVDTFIDVDTVYYPKPVPKIVKVVDTMYIDKDSIQQEGDSILLPREEKTYEDSTYKAVVSGFKPSLDEISVYPVTKYVTTEKIREIEKKQHWNYGVGLGFGYGMFNKKFDVFIGGTVGYNF